MGPAHPTGLELAPGLSAPWHPASAATTGGAALTAMRILIVDDQAFNIAVISGMLREAGYQDIVSTRDPRSVPEVCAAERPDLVLLDFHMPGMTGLDVLGSLAGLVHGPESLPVLVVTSDPTAQRRYDCLAAGARDFLTKPVDQVELLLRVRTHLLTRHLQLAAERRAEDLDDAVRARTVELEEARVERADMMRHVHFGAKMLATARSPILRLAAEIAVSHHERWDGHGYLAGLGGEDIPLSGRITSVADVFDALTHERPYKAAWERDRALDEIAS
jgi:putative two-component system response regulator